MQKPQPCKQNWAEMKPTDGGRVCSQCEKTIVDFSNMKWQQIHNFQADRNFEICGFYNPKQLEYWSQEIPKKSCSNFAKSVAIVVALLLSNESSSQDLLQVIENRKFVEGVVVCRMSNEFVPFATISVKGTNILTKSDFNGNFKLDITSYEDSKENNILVFSNIGFTTMEFKLDSIVEGKMKFFIDCNLPLTTFYVTDYKSEENENILPNTKTQKRKFKNWFKKPNQ